MYLLPKKAVQKLRLRYLVHGTHRPIMFRFKENEDSYRLFKKKPLFKKKTFHKDDNCGTSDDKIATAYQPNVLRTQRPHVSVTITPV